MGNRDFILKHLLPYIVVRKDNDLMIDFNKFDNIDGRIYTKR